MNSEQVEVEHEIEKLNQEIEEIEIAMDGYEKAKKEAETKLKKELKKAKELNKLKNQKIDRYNSKTMELLGTMEKIYDDMYKLHSNAEVMNGAKNTIQKYKTEFEGLVKLHEDITAIDVNKVPQRKFVCVCQTGLCEQMRPPPTNNQHSKPAVRQPSCPCSSRS